VILYADTSALVKRYVREVGSTEAVTWLRGAEFIGANVITRAEMAAVFSRLHRAGLAGTLELQIEFHRDWAGFIRLAVEERLVANAEHLAWRYGLRGYEAVHLASVLVWQGDLGEPVTLATYDRRLWEAALAEGLGILPEGPPQ
jgi:uncharacterized protein